ncbi:hypothetical protein FACS1894188_10580 [Clostridia bacterium]|nr:hypothetical protein FACS1894188_10580 [Clostridia bacterium]
MIIDSLRTFLQTCPFLKVSSVAETPMIYVDYLGETSTTYAIETVPAPIWYRRYVDGGGIKQTQFVFRSIEPYDGRDVLQSLQNMAFYEKFEEWLAQNSQPNIDSWVRVEALTGGYIHTVFEGQDAAVYQIQCRVLYVV